MKILNDRIDKNVRALINWIWRQHYKRQAVGFLLTIVSLGFVYFQLREINHTNKVTIRGQLYDRQIQMGVDMTAPDAEILSAMWALVPPQLETNEVARTFLSLATFDPTALKAAHPAELYHSMFDLPSSRIARVAKAPSYYDACSFTRRTTSITSTIFLIISAMAYCRRLNGAPGRELYVRCMRIRCFSP